MQIELPTPLLGGISPAAFMRDYWQKKPLLVRSAIPGFKTPLTRARLFALAAHEDVESRLLVRRGEDWELRHGPLPRRSLPTLATPDWTMLVQGVDLHDAAARALMDRFRFVPDARLDDLMISYATAGGGVGPHFDSYDVFLLQAHGKRRWRIGRQEDLSLVEGLPLKILKHFTPEQDWVLEPGDMLYLPPKWAHDGIAMDECMTCSIGFRSPDATELAAELLFRMAGEPRSPGAVELYADPRQAATEAPARIPDALRTFAQSAIRRLLASPSAAPAALGDWLTEPKATVWFDRPETTVPLQAGAGLEADRRTRMLYDDARFYINGEHVPMNDDCRAAWCELANRRALQRETIARMDEHARSSLQDWLDAGWLHPQR